MKKDLFIGTLVSLFALSPAMAADDKGASGAAAQPTANTSANASGSNATTGAGGSGTSEAGRDWSKVDRDGDSSISAEEMEAWLQANPGPLKQ